MMLKSTVIMLESTTFDNGINLDDAEVDHSNVRIDHDNAEI